MDILDIIKKRRSIRRFKQEVLKREDLLTLIEVACFAHSVCNRQSLRYMIIMDREKVKNVFENSSLGLVAKGEEGLTDETQAPTAYILITAQGSPSHIDYADAGSSYQNMGLVAMQLNLGLFWLHAFASDILHETLNVPEDQTIISIIAVGRPAESPIAVSIDPEEQEKYNDLNEKNNKVPKLKTKYMVSWR
ncbi:MAG: nitroreductase family protein [Lentisphaeraceae bacterium]|nr:nitroreductase family protein [Lentisphaeraceae bacterium]